MTYIVTFLDDDNGIHVKEIVGCYETALRYASAVAVGRKPKIWKLKAERQEHYWEEWN